MKIKVSEKGAIIPKEILPGIDELELRIENDRIILVPVKLVKANENNSALAHLQKMAGMFDSGTSDTSQNAKTLVADKIARKYGKK